jgi:hypothetical protein
MIKLVHGSKNKLIKLDKPAFPALQALIRNSFSNLPVDFTLSYLDQDKDEISLNSDEDVLIMLNSGIKVNKVYIKQSLSQVIEITDHIEPSFDFEDPSQRVEKQEVSEPVSSPFEKVEKVLEEVVLQPVQEEQNHL